MTISRRKGLNPWKCAAFVFDPGSISPSPSLLSIGCLQAIIPLRISREMDWLCPQTAARRKSGLCLQQSLFIVRVILKNLATVMRLAFYRLHCHSLGVWAPLGVHFCFRRAGFWVYIHSLTPVFLPNSLLDKLQAAEQRLVVKMPSLLAKRILHALSL